MARQFRLNKVDGKILGVCAGLADHFEVDVSLVRVAMVVAMLLTFPFAGLCYLIVALVASSGGGRPEHRFSGGEAPRLTDPAMDATRDRVRDLDHRLAAIEDHLASSNNALAREIDSLR